MGRNSRKSEMTLKSELEILENFRKSEEKNRNSNPPLVLIIKTGPYLLNLILNVLALQSTKY